MVARGEVDLAPRVETPKAPVAERVGDFREVELLPAARSKPWARRPAA